MSEEQLIRQRRWGMFWFLAGLTGWVVSMYLGFSYGFVYAMPAVPSMMIAGMGAGMVLGAERIYARKFGIED